MNTLNADIKTLSRHVADSNSRPELQAVHVTPTLLESTDSYSLLQVMPPEPLNVTDVSNTVGRSYPETKHITDNLETDKAIKVIFNMNYMKSLLLSLIELERNHGERYGLHDVTMTVTNGMNPIVLEKYMPHDKTSVRALLMPIRR